MSAPAPGEPARFFHRQQIQFLSADFVSRFVFCQQIPSADFCREQFFFLSPDSVSRFLK
jgi:hypothetical protein